MPRAPRSTHHLTRPALEILLSLADEARHGLGIVREVEERSRGEVTLGPATLYGTIKWLRESGLIDEPETRPAAEDDDPRRRYYRISGTGRDALEAEIGRLEELVRKARRKTAARDKAGS